MKNLFKTAIKSFKRYKIYSIINFLGLVLGLSCSMVILMYVGFEYSFDKFHTDKNRIFRVAEIWTKPSGTDNSPRIRMPYGPALKNEIPEITDFVRLSQSWRPKLFVYNNQKIEIEKIAYADSSLFNFFSFPVILGNSSTILNNEESIVLTQKIAHRVFGNKNPLGESVKFDNEWFTVSGVVENVPCNSHIQFDAVIPMRKLLNTPGVYTGWDGGYSVNTFVKLNSPENKNTVESKLPDFLWGKINKKQEEAGFYSEFYLEPLEQIHLHSDVDWDINRKEAKNVLTLLIIGLLVLFVAVLNYLFISSGTLMLRAKEFNIKSVLGFSKVGIAKQITVETFFMFLIAGGISYGIIRMLHPYIIQLFDVDFISHLPLRSALCLFFLILILSAVSTLVLFVNYNQKLKWSKNISTLSSPNKSKNLVYISAFQFCISIGLIAAIIIVNKQLNFALNKDLGFATKNMVNLSHSAVGKKQHLLIAEMEKIPGVESASASYGVPGLETTANGYKPEGYDNYLIFSALYIDDNFFNTFNIELIKGRNFKKGTTTNAKKAIINETLAKKLNWENPVGKTISRNGNYEIIGVVKDFHVGLVYSKIPPLIISKEWKEEFYSLSMRLNPNNTWQTIEQIRETWTNLMPDTPFNLSFMDDKFKQLYADIQQTVTILLIFTCISILISVLGLFGITFLLLNSKVKEIGIRKVNGATVIEILTLLNKKFVKWVAIAFIVATPLTFYIMQKWMQSFAYKTQISWWIFALAGSIALGISLLTVSWQSLRVATRNPVDSMRYE